jgi:dTDP-4-amino-4,6-dideoxygalactose transaminase
MTEAARKINLSPSIPFIDLQAQRRRIAPRIDQAIAAVLAHGQFIMGPEIAQLEARLAAHCGARHAIGCGSGTDALLLALMALDAGPGDAVFVPSFTFTATAEAVALVGATPVFVDIDAATFNMDPASLAQAIAMVAGAGKLRPAGVIPVDLFGQPADYDAIETIAAAHGLWVVADAAQSYGAMRQSRKAGTRGRITTTSFFPAKPLGCYGDGGAVFTGDDGLADKMRSLLFHGRASDHRDHVRIGMNGRLDTIQAAILLVKLEIFDDEMERRQLVAARYGEGLREVAGVPALAEATVSAWAQYTIVVDGRDAIAAELKAQGIPTAMYYPLPVHRQAAYRGYPVVSGGLPVSERLAGQTLSLPMHPYLDEATQGRIIGAVQGVAIRGSQF